jgi:protein SCO1/2
MKETAALVLLLVLAAAEPARAQPPILRDIGIDQRLDVQVPLDLTFRDEAGRRVRLGEYFAGKPVILVLAYYRCPMLCTQVLNGLVRALLDVKLELGKDFEVVTVSFDPREQPELAAAKKKTYLDRYGHREGAEDGWHFLTGDEGPIKQLADAVGFHYRYDAKNDQYAHASGIMVLTPAGKVSRYFLDVRFDAKQLRLSLVDASNSKIGSLADKIFLFCFHYDPIEGKYGLAVMNLVRLGGVLTMLGIGTLVVLLRRQEKRRRAGGTPATQESCVASVPPATPVAEGEK